MWPILPSIGLLLLLPPLLPQSIAARNFIVTIRINSQSRAMINTGSKGHALAVFVHGHLADGRRVRAKARPLPRERRQGATATMGAKIENGGRRTFKRCARMRMMRAAGVHCKGGTFSTWYDGVAVLREAALGGEGGCVGVDVGFGDASGSVGRTGLRRRAPLAAISAVAAHPPGPLSGTAADDVSAPYAHPFPARSCAGLPRCEATADAREGLLPRGGGFARAGDGQSVCAPPRKGTASRAKDDAEVVVGARHVVPLVGHLGEHEGSLGAAAGRVGDGRGDVGLHRAL